MNGGSGIMLDNHFRFRVFLFDTCQLIGFLVVVLVVPDPVSYKLYVQIDYYSTYVDEESKVQSGINYIQTLLYPLNIESGTYEEPVSVPPYEETVVSDYSKLTYRIPYDFLGVTKSGWKFFVVKTEEGFNSSEMAERIKCLMEDDERRRSFSECCLRAGSESRRSRR